MTPDQELAVDEDIRKEISLGRMAGPFRIEEVESAMGSPIRSSPISVIPKVVPPGHPPKNRIITNHAYDKPGFPSVNAPLKSADFPFRYFKNAQFEDAFRDLPKHVLVTTWDIKDAFKVIALHPDVRPHFCVWWRGAVFIVKNACFGTCTTPGMFGRLMDITLDYLHLIFGDRLKVMNVSDDVAGIIWDILLSRETILRPSLDLGWLIHELWNKGSAAARAFLLNGLWWDLDAQTKMIPESKREKYLAYVDWFLEEGCQVNLTETEKLVGYLQYVTMTARTRRTFLARLYKFRRRFNEEDWITKRVVREVRACLENWQKFLRSTNITSSYAIPPKICDLVLTSDASSFGLGIVVGSYARFYPLMENWKEVFSADIGPAEAWAAEALLQAAIAMGAEDCVVTLVGDNQGFIFAWEKGWSKSPLTNKVIRRMNDLALLHGLVVKMEWICSEENVADSISRGIIPDGFVDFPESLNLKIPRGVVGGGLV